MRQYILYLLKITEAESIEKHGLWDPMPELTITSPYVHSRLDSNTFTMGGQSSARVDLSPSKGLRIWPPERKRRRELKWDSGQVIFAQFYCVTWCVDYVCLNHWIMTYAETVTKCRYLKILTCKGTLRQVFIRVYRLEIQTVMLAIGIFDPGLRTVAFGSTLPPHPLSLCE
jgi:hypothetical protein